MRTMNMNSDKTVNLLGRMLFCAGLCLAALLCSASAHPERYRLYTKPDPEATGGIKGTVAYPSRPIEQILAIPPDEPRLVYKGTISGSSRRDFSFSGLPMRKYDLVIIYDDQFYEGLTLQRGEDTLTETDRQKITTTINKAEPYFTRKIIHRLQGTTGRGNLARCVCTFMRDKVPANSPKEARNIRRTFRLFMLKDVGPGWQVVRSRDLYPVWTTKGKMAAKHHYEKALSKIRVTKSVKDIGQLNLKSLR